MKHIRPDIWLITVAIITSADIFLIWYDFTRGKLFDFGFDCFCLGMMVMVIAFAVIDCLDFRERAREVKRCTHCDDELSGKRKLKEKE